MGTGQPRGQEALHQARAAPQGHEDEAALLGHPVHPALYAHAPRRLLLLWPILILSEPADDLGVGLSNTDQDCSWQAGIFCDVDVLGCCQCRLDIGRLLLLLLCSFGRGLPLLALCIGVVDRFLQSCFSGWFVRFVALLLDPVLVLGSMLQESLRQALKGAGLCPLSLLRIELLLFVDEYDRHDPLRVSKLGSS